MYVCIFEAVPASKPEGLREEPIFPGLDHFFLGGHPQSEAGLGIGTVSVHIKDCEEHISVLWGESRG